MLEERIRNRAEEENLIKEKEVKVSLKSTCLLSTSYANKIKKLFRESVTFYDVFLHITFDSYYISDCEDWR